MRPTLCALVALAGFAALQTQVASQTVSVSGPRPRVSGIPTPGPMGPMGPRGPASSMPGPKGDKGDTGAPGADGVDGAPGATGATGVGLPGKNGIDGKDGAPGPRGLPGADGQPGKDGVAGAAGRNGTDGRNGVDGLPGATGATGPSAAVQLGSVVIGQTATVALALGPRAVTAPLAGCVAGERVLLTPTAPLPLGYGILDGGCYVAGVLTVNVYGPALALGASYSITVRVTAVR